MILKSSSNRATSTHQTNETDQTEKQTVRVGEEPKPGFFSPLVSQRHLCTSSEGEVASRRFVASLFTMSFLESRSDLNAPPASLPLWTPPPLHVTWPRPLRGVSSGRSPAPRG
ncbi:hypothetical protein CesoFtcFv8_005711 [Champsocephalus esox]|uniref:Uncharacterized protein n=1 Tax=Champsocephalus esox TaxID=159716 RepID=A0AAN8H649_9TELE|nr:hypothetical protein CesoFtcFv8_005711 [Champsocephalus esox]